MVPGKLQNIRMTIDSRRLALEHAGPLAGDGADHKSWKSLGSGLPNGVEPALPFENPSALPPPPVWPWARHLNSLSTSVLISQMESRIHIPPTPPGASQVR